MSVSAPPRPPARREVRPPTWRMRLHRWRATPGEVLTAIVVGGILAAWWPLQLALDSGAPLELSVVTAHVAGMLAGYGVLVLLALMSRSPALERGVGADVLARWHARAGRIVLALIVVHAVAAVFSWARSRGESVGAALLHVVALPDLLTATVGTVLLVGVGVASARAARRRLGYETWHAIHFTTYVGIALSFSHELAGPDLAGHRCAQIAWALLYAHVFGLLIRHRFVTPLRQASRHHLRVVAVRPEGPGVVSIEVQGSNLDELEAEPGQFFRWRFLTAGTWLTAHPFSLSAPPRGDRLRLTVKALGRGSTRLQSVPVGTRILAQGPYGAMTAARRTRRNVLLIAGGVGITPMRTLFETLPLEPGQDLTLLYRARNPEDLVFRDELDHIARRRGARVVYLLGDNRDSLSPDGLFRLVPDLLHREVYLCGPPGLADAVRSSLGEAGLDPRHLHEERFAF